MSLFFGWGGYFCIVMLFSMVEGLVYVEVYKFVNKVF